MRVSPLVVGRCRIWRPKVAPRYCVATTGSASVRSARDRRVDERQRAHVGGDRRGAGAVGGIGEQRRDGRREPADVVERHAGAELGHAAGVVGLVREQRQDGERDARGEPRPDRAEAAVTGHRRGVRHHRRLRDPALRVDVARQRAEGGGIVFPAGGDEHADRQRGERVDRRAVEPGEEAHLRRDRAEREVHERRVVAAPPVGQRLDRDRPLAEAARVRGAGRVEQRRREREVGGLRLRLGGQPEPRAQRRERRERDRHELPLDRAEPDADDGDGHPGPLGGERPGELGALGQHEVGLPVRDDRAQVVERRGAVEADERLGDDEPVRRVVVEVARTRRRSARAPRAAARRRSGRRSPARGRGPPSSRSWPRGRRRRRRAGPGRRGSAARSGRRCRGW